MDCNAHAQFTRLRMRSHYLILSAFLGRRVVSRLAGVACWPRSFRSSRRSWCDTCAAKLKSVLKHTILLHTRTSRRKVMRISYVNLLVGHYILRIHYKIETYLLLQKEDIFLKQKCH